MAPRHLADIVHIGLDVLTTAISSVTGFVTAQLGDVVSGVAKSDDAEWYFPPGFVGRVRSPDSGTAAAQVVVVTRSDHDAIVGCRDSRVKAIFNTLDVGETAIFASAVGGGVAVFKKDGSIAVTAGDGAASVTIKAGGEIDVFGSTVKIGDAGAVALAKATGISVLQAAITGWLPTGTGDGASLKTALTTWLAANYATTKVSGT